MCLFACESAVMAVALSVAVSLLASKPVSDATRSENFGVVLVAVVLTSLVMYALGLYERTVLGDVRRALPRLAVLFAAWTGIILVAMKFIGDGEDPAQTTLYVASAVAAFGGVTLARILYVTVARATIAPHRVIVVGVGERAAEIEYLNSGRQRSECKVVGYASLADQRAQVPRSRMVEIKTSLLALAREHGAKEIVVALDDRRGTPLEPLLEARMSGITITSYLSFWEREARRVNLKGLDPSWMIYSDGYRIGTFTNTVLKRILDILASLALLVFTLPTLILAAVAIGLESAGPIFYRQERIGRNGVPFTIYKFRTMQVNAEGSGIPQWASARDPRITSVGWLLRMTRIDELPQIWNILRGDMSFVGPRPERPFFVKMLSEEIPFYRERHRVRPGLTGWAQINYPYGASMEDARAKLSYDLYYIKNYSLMFDFLIILSTAHAVFFKKGAR
jgi:sugar transferase (PEP-CTERM system associated)